MPVVRNNDFVAAAGRAAPYMEARANKTQEQLDRLLNGFTDLIEHLRNDFAQEHQELTQSFADEEADTPEQMPVHGAMPKAAAPAANAAAAREPYVEELPPGYVPVNAAALQAAVNVVGPAAALQAVAAAPPAANVHVANLRAAPIPAAAAAPAAAAPAAGPPAAAAAPAAAPQYPFPQVIPQDPELLENLQCPNFPHPFLPLPPLDDHDIVPEDEMVLRARSMHSYAALFCGSHVLFKTKTQENNGAAAGGENNTVFYVMNKELNNDAHKRHARANEYMYDNGFKAINEVLVRHNHHAEPNHRMTRRQRKQLYTELRVRTYLCVSMLPVLPYHQTSPSRAA
jgi:hypothetical protein